MQYGEPARASSSSPSSLRGGETVEAIQSSANRPWIAARPAVARNDEGEGRGTGAYRPRFAPAALTLCALAARTLGWRPQEFWAATPAELAAALGLLSPGTTDPGIDRDTLQRLMEHDHGR